MNHDAHALVSVIVPTYNTEAFLDQCLLSIRNQTHTELEILCVNDGSTDGSLAIMQRHAAEDARIRIIDKENGGYGAGCNRGIAEARGEWVSIIEPDDWIDSTMYEEMLAFAAGFSRPVDIVKTPWWDIKYWDDPERMKPYPCLLTGRVRRSEAPATIRELPQLLAYHPAIWSALYRRDFLLEAGIRFPEYPGAGWADNPFLIDTMCQARGIVYLDRPFYRYRADLPGSTRNHATPEAVTRPFDPVSYTHLDVYKRQPSASRPPFRTAPTTTAPTSTWRSSSRARSRTSSTACVPSSTATARTSATGSTPRTTAPPCGRSSRRAASARRTSSAPTASATTSPSCARSSRRSAATPTTSTGCATAPATTAATPSTAPSLSLIHI